MRYNNDQQLTEYNKNTIWQGTCNSASNGDAALLDSSSCSFLLGSVIINSSTETVNTAYLTYVGLNGLSS